MSTDGVIISNIRARFSLSFFLFLSLLHSFLFFHSIFSPFLFLFFNFFFYFSISISFIPFLFVSISFFISFHFQFPFIYFHLIFFLSTFFLFSIYFSFFPYFFSPFLSSFIPSLLLPITLLWFLHTSFLPSFKFFSPLLPFSHPRLWRSRLGMSLEMKPSPNFPDAFVIRFCALAMEMDDMARGSSSSSSSFPPHVPRSILPPPLPPSRRPFSSSC